MSSDDPIHDVLDRWHQHLKGQLPGGLDALLHEDCVFLSPVVFSPQRGREISKLYLSAAANVLPGDEAASKPATNDDEHERAGAAYVFKRTDETRDGAGTLTAPPYWPSKEHFKLQPPDHHARARFGADLALVGASLAAGAPGDDNLGRGAGAVA